MLFEQAVQFEPDVHPEQFPGQAEQLAAPDKKYPDWHQAHPLDDPIQHLLSDKVPVTQVPAKLKYEPEAHPVTY
jgi:hypothetical protein